jgi:hypothetical protein
MAHKYLKFFLILIFISFYADLIAQETNKEIPKKENNALEELKIKRDDVFEFSIKPIITRQGDKVEIKFESKGYCDVTIVVENEEGKIIRHLASGVLGSNAPLPFQKKHQNTNNNLGWQKRPRSLC